MTGDQSDGAFALAEQHLPAGHVTPLHVQPHEDETFHVIDGRPKVHLDGREVTVGAGETVLVRRRTPHALRADTATHCLMLDVPAKHERFFFAVGRPAPDRRLPDPIDGLPDLEAMAAAAREARFELLGPPAFG